MANGPVSGFMIDLQTPQPLHAACRVCAEQIACKPECVHDVRGSVENVDVDVDLCLFRHQAGHDPAERARLFTRALLKSRSAERLPARGQIAQEVLLQLMPAPDGPAFRVAALARLEWLADDALL